MSRPTNAPGSISSRRGRPRTFDADTALLQAIEAFRCNGYEATSLDNLTAALGLNRSSFYSCFGSKRALFLSAIDRYGEQTLERLDSVIARSRTPRTRIHACLESVVQPDGDRSGCFVQNCLFELAALDPAIDQRVTGYIDEIAIRLEAPVRELVPLRRVTAVRDALLNCAFGALSLRVSGAKPAAIRGVLRTTSSALLNKDG